MRSDLLVAVVGKRFEDKLIITGGKGVDFS